MGASKTVLDRSFPCELRLLNGVLQRRRLSRFVLVLGLLLHLLSAVHSLNGRYWLYSSASHLRNDIVIFVNVVSDLLMVAVNALGLTQLIISPFLPRLFGFCTAPKPILTNGSLSRFSRWIDLLRFGPLPPLVIGIGLFWRQAGWAAYQFFLARQLWYYLMNLLICTFICVVLQLRCEFARANAFLSTGLQGPPAHLQLLSAHFVRLCDLLDKFNRTFKALMVTVVMSLTWNILHNCTSLIEYAAKPKSFDIKVATFLTQPLLALTTVSVGMGLITRGVLKLFGGGYPELRLFMLALRFRRLYGFVQVVLVLMHVGLFGYSLMGRPLVYQRFPPFGSSVVAFAALLNDAMVLVHCVFAIVAITRPTPLADLLYAALREHHSGHQWSFRVYVALLRLAPLLPTAAGVWLYWDLYGYFVHRDFCYYSLNLTIYSSAGILQRINGTFRAGNDQLEQFGRQLRRLQWRLALDHLAKLRTFYSQLYRLIDTFNSYAKGMMVVMVICLCVNILFNLTVITQFAIKPPDPHTKALVYLIHALFTLTSVGQAAVVAFVGEGLEEEGERTTRICYTLINQLNNSAKVEPLIARELHFILEHSRARKVCLHAGGFFRVNWGILGAITSTVATYSIVIIQFLLK